MEFPNEWPDDCPPTGAEPPEQEKTVYRAVDNEPPTADDFQSAYQLGNRLNADDCLRRALSVFTKESDLEHKMKAFNIGDKVAEGTLNEESGRTKDTGNDSHLSWWPAESVTREATFQVV